MAKKNATLEYNAIALKRWRSKLKRAMTMIDKLERERKRIEKQLTVAHIDKMEAKVQVEHAEDKVLADLNPFPPKEEFMKIVKGEIDTTIPDFLKVKPDPVAEQIKAEQAETKKLKARGRIEKMKAKKRGDLKKMPLTGKEALAFASKG